MVELVGQHSRGGEPTASSRGRGCRRRRAWRRNRHVIEGSSRQWRGAAGCCTQDHAAEQQRGRWSIRRAGSGTGKQEAPAGASQTSCGARTCGARAGPVKACSTPDSLTTCGSSGAGRPGYCNTIVAHSRQPGLSSVSRRRPSAGGTRSSRAAIATTPLQSSSCAIHRDQCLIVVLTPHDRPSRQPVHGCHKLWQSHGGKEQAAVAAVAAGSSRSSGQRGG